MMDCKNKVAFITGGTKGIGFGIAQALLHNEMKVAITGRSQESLAVATNKLGENHKDNVLGLVSDVKNFESQQEAIQSTLTKWGKIDVLIANAGVGHFETIENLTLAQWNDVIDTNLTGVFYTLKAGLDALKKTKGNFITISSLAAAHFFATGAAYNASKFGLNGFSHAVMLDLRGYGIRTTTLMPGHVDTYFNQNVPDSQNNQWKIQIEDMGKAVLDIIRLDSRSMISKVEIRPSIPKK